MYRNAPEGQNQKPKTVLLKQKDANKKNLKTVFFSDNWYK